MYERVLGHRLMLADQVRVTSYQKAIHEVVNEGDIVADIGTGSGILAFFAIQAGARKVYAVEQGDIIEDAEKLAQINGLEDKIVFLKGRSDRVELPEKADVITSELIGFFGLEENLHRFKIDARKRFLKPNGKLVPSWLELFMVPVESNALWQEHVGFWSGEYYGFDFSPVKGHAVSQRYVTDCSGKVKRLAIPIMIAHINFYETDSVPLVFQEQAVICKTGDLHGLVGYFRAGLSPGVVLSTAPEEPLTHWKQTFFPIEEAVLVKNGDKVRYKIKAIPQGNALYWEWNTSVHRNGAKIAGFSQSNLRISKEDLVAGRASFRPVLTQEGEIRRRALDLCDGQRSMGEISELLRAEYPEKYKTAKAAMQDLVDMVRSVVRIE